MPRTAATSIHAIARISSCWIILPVEEFIGGTFLERIGFAFVEGVIFEDVIANYQLLFRTNLAVLIDEPMYFYRVGRQGQITGRKDHTVLDILLVLNMVVDELWNHSASVELWANFICVQGWNMLWQCDANNRRTQGKASQRRHEDCSEISSSRPYAFSREVWG